MMMSLLCAGMARMSKIRRFQDAETRTQPKGKRQRKAKTPIDETPVFVVGSVGLKSFVYSLD